MKQVENYDEWLDWASENAYELEFWDRVYPRLELLEEAGYLDVPEEVEIGSTEDIAAILRGEARWESREENEAEAVWMNYDLPIEFRQAEKQYVKDYDLPGPFDFGRAGILDDEVLRRTGLES